MSLSTLNRSKMPLVIVISGIIGSGKSTLISLLGSRLAHEKYKVVVVPEPVENWQKTGLFDEYCSDVSRWGYTFQTEAYRSRIMIIREIYEKNKDADIILMERSPWDDKLFMEMLHESQQIKQMEWELYLGWCDMWDLLLPFGPSIFVHVDPSVEECRTRIIKRGRKGEELLSDEYHQNLKKKHDQFFSSGSLGSSGTIPRMVSPEDEVFETTVVLKNTLVPCYHLKTKDNFKEVEEAKKKVTEIFKKIIEHHS